MPATLFDTPGQFLEAVRHAERDRDFAATEMYPHAAMAHNGQQDPHGGYLIPEEWSQTVLGIAMDDRILNRCRQFQMNAPVTHVPARFSETRSTTSTGGLAVQIKPERQAYSPSQMTLESVSLRARTHGAVAFASDEILEDAGLDFLNLLGESFREELGWHLTQFVIDGNGVDAPLGILISPSTITVAKEVGQADNTIVYENVVGMLARCWDTSAAVWVANQNCYPQLLNLKDSNDHRVWNGDLNDFLGRPILFTEHAKSVGNRGDLILGDFNQYLVGVHRAVQAQSSVHVRFLNRESTFKFWVRLDGAPWWRVPVTPANGTDTLSPFVVLADRLP